MSQLDELVRMETELEDFVATHPTGEVKISFNSKNFTLKMNADLYDSFRIFLDEQIQQES